jgi:hypothetical protein
VVRADVGIRGGRIAAVGGPLSGAQVLDAGGLLEPLAEYRRRAACAMVDYAFHQIVMEVTGWPVATLLRGRIAMRDGVVMGEPGSGRHLAREAYDLIRPSGVLPDGFDASEFA